MNQKQLHDEAHQFLELVENMGEFDHLDSDEMKVLFKTTAGIIMCLENNQELMDKAVEHSGDLAALKELAVSLHKSIPIKAKLEELVGSIDCYELTDLAERMIDNLDEEEDHV
jgi:hypothetical protein